MMWDLGKKWYCTGRLKDGMMHMLKLSSIASSEYKEWEKLQ